MQAATVTGQPSGSESNNIAFTREILTGGECRAVVPEITEEVMLYRYRHSAKPWTLCIGTLGTQGSGKLSLGGFRIVPEARAASPGFSPEREAIGLACGMEEKVYWSRLIRVAGPLGIKNLDRVVGGKCVLLPSSTSRVGQREDRAMLDFAVAALNDFEAHSGVFVTTGQDLGHGVLSDGKTTSLEYLHARFPGSVVADTSGPTAEGNLHALFGMLRGAGLNPSAARIGLIGYGNIGHHLVRRLSETLGEGVFSRLLVVEPVESRREELSARGAKVFALGDKFEFLKESFDALVLNANGGSLDSETVSRIVANPAIKVVCGCENLVMPNPADGERLRAARKLYCPTELCGMMGYLTAVEEYLASKAGEKLSLADVLKAAAVLDPACERAARRALSGDVGPSFETAMRAEFSG